MKIFEEKSRGAAILASLRDAGRPPLGPGGLRKEIVAALSRLSDLELLGLESSQDPKAAACVRAGLLLFAGDIEASHAICQAVETREGSYWHALVHRREGDFGNSKYWFRRVGDHPVFEKLVPFLLERTTGRESLPKARWDAFHLVDLVEACETGERGDLREALEEIQEREMLLLLDHCHRLARGERT